MSERILVTGGSGFIGAALVRRLLEKGYTVRVLDNNSRGSRERLGLDLDKTEFVEGDIRDYSVVEEAVRGVDRVAHLAFVNGTEFFYEYPELVLDVGVKGAINTLDAAIAHGVSDYLLLSSSEVYQTPSEVPTDETAELSVPDAWNPRYSYGGGKLISELLTINYGRKHFRRAVVVRPHNVYGPNMGWEHVIPQFVAKAKQAIADTPEGETVSFPIHGDGSQTRAFAYIDDFVEGCLLAFERGENLGIYHIGTEEEIPIHGLVKELFDYLGYPYKIIPGPEPEGATPRRCPDITRVRQLGYEPQVALKEGLKLTVDWYWNQLSQDA